jgi:hypothetical protein
MFKTILNKLHKNALLVKCNGFTDYLLIKFLTNNKWEVYNTSFSEEDIDHITVFSSKENIAAEIVLKGV